MFLFEVKAGQTVTVYLAAGFLDFTVVDVFGVRKSKAGIWKIKFGNAEASDHKMGYVESSFEVF